MNILLLCNILEIGFIIYRLIVWCPNDEYKDYAICDFKNRIRYIPEYTVVFTGGIFCLIFTILHFLNLLICYKNFGKDFGFYCKYFFFYSLKISFLLKNNNDEGLLLF